MATESFFSNASLAYLASAGAGKDGKAYSIKPTDGTGDFTFSRGTDLTATRVGPTGLIEKGRQNLLKQSNTFNVSPWSTNIGVFTGGQSGYDGTSDAWKFESNGGSTTFLLNTESASGVNTASIYAKAGNVDYIRFGFNPSSESYGFFDLSGSGNVVSQLNSPIDAKIESAGNGWFRCSVTNNVSATGVVLYLSPDGIGLNVADGAFVYIQDAQLELGLAATDYIESGASTGKAGLLEDEPRFDYSGGATCPSLLLEPQRVQLLPYTEYLDTSTTWNGYPSADPVTHTQNYAIAPDGTQTASLLGNFTSGGFNAVNNSNYRTPTLATQNPLDDTYTMSVWLKTTSGTGTISLLNRGLSSGTNSPTSLQCNVTNEWQRFDLSNTYTAAEGASSLGFIIIKTNTDTLEEVLVWGAQMEQGSYPTSYIPNHSGGSATRTEDDLTSTLLSIDGLFGPTSGSIFMEFTNPLQGLNNNWFSMTGVAAGAAAYMRVRGYWQMNIPQLTWNPSPNIGNTDEATKIAVKWGGGIAKIFIDGAEDAATTYTGGDINMNVSLTGINGGFNFAQNDANFKQILFFPEALSDADCISLTTL